MASGKHGTPDSLLASQGHIKFAKRFALFACSQSLKLLVVQLVARKLLTRSSNLPAASCTPSELGAEGKDR